MRAFSFLLIALAMTGTDTPAAARPFPDVPSAGSPMPPQVIFVSRSSKIVRSAACSSSQAKGKRKKSYCAKAKPAS